MRPKAGGQKAKMKHETSVIKQEVCINIWKDKRIQSAAAPTDGNHSLLLLRCFAWQWQWDVL